MSGFARVMAGANADVAFVEDLAHVVRMQITEGEAQHAAADGSVVGPVDGDVVAESLVECIEGVARELDLVLSDGIHAEVFEELDGGA